ncbi:MAG: S8 family serine peptidase [Streptobacillus sp.]
MKYINNKNYQRFTTLSLTLFALVSCSSMSNRVYYSEEEKDKIEDIIERGSNTNNSWNNEIKHLVYEDDFYLLEKVNKYDKHNMKNYSLHLNEYKEDQPYYNDSDIKEYKANQKFNVSTSDDDPLLYTDTVENSKYRYKQDLDDNPSVLIGELYYTQTDKDFINKYLKSIKNNFVLDKEKDITHFPHLSMVTRAFLDKNILDYYTNDYLKNANDFKLYGMVRPKDTEKSDQVNFQGIINMSYANTMSMHLGDEYISPKAFLVTQPNDRYLNRIQSYLSFVSNSLKYKNHIYNDQLKVIAIGNTPDDVPKDVNNKYFSNYMSNFYHYLSPEMQKLARNDNIFVKEVFLEKNVKERGYKFEPKYKTVRLDSLTNGYVSREYGDLNLNKSNANAMYLRANTVGNLSTVYSSADVWHTGSSFSTPHTTRAAYEIKKKFPWMSYNQVKQTILTTADNDNSGYLNDYTGWGVVNLESALRGPAQFNAGLIDEEKYYVGMPSRIFDNPYSKNKGTHYFYANIPYDMTSTFSNHITGGLSGDGYNNDYRVYDTITLKNNNLDIVHMPYKMPKVLDSERKFYANFAEGGLRKDGEGTLILDGKQLYKSNTQVLKGTLELNNDSNSKYEIFRDGTFRINSKLLNYKLFIFNDIISDGTVEFNGYVKAGQYKASRNSLTRINFDGENKLKFDGFETSGKLAFNISKGNDLESVHAFISSNNINIDKTNIINPLLKELVLKNNDLIRLNSTTHPKYTFFENSSKEVLRNLPSYDDNKKEFFKEYIIKYGVIHNDIFEKVLETNAPYTRYSDYDNKYSSYGVANGDTVISRNKAFVSLMNYTGNENKLFTNIYTNVLGYNLKQNFMRLENIHSNIKNTDKLNVGINESVQYLSNKKGFNNIFVSNDLSSSTSLFNNKLFLKGLVGYTWGKGNDKEDNFNNHSVYANGRIELNPIKNTILKYELDGNFNYINGSRKFQDSDIKYTFDTKTISNTIGLENKLINKSNFKLSSMIDYINTIMILGDFKEKTEDTRNMSYLKEYKDNIIIKNYLSTGFNTSLDLNLNNNKLNLSANAGLIYNINPKVYIKNSMLDVKFKEALPLENKYGIFANIKASYTVDKNIFTVGFGVNNLGFETNTLNNIKLNIGYNRTF